MPSVNQAACLSCDVGFFSNETGSVVCQSCQPGYFQNVAGNNTWYVFENFLAFDVVNLTLYLTNCLVLTAFHVWQAHTWVQVEEHRVYHGRLYLGHR